MLTSLPLHTCQKTWPCFSSIFQHSVSSCKGLAFADPDIDSAFERTLSCVVQEILIPYMYHSYLLITLTANLFVSTQTNSFRNAIIFIKSMQYESCQLVQQDWEWQSTKVIANLMKELRKEAHPLLFLPHHQHRLSGSSSLKAKLCDVWQQTNSSCRWCDYGSECATVPPLFSICSWVK